MKVKNIVSVVSLYNLSDYAVCVARRSARKRAQSRVHLEIINDELEQRLLMAAFSYDSVSGLLTVQTDANNEQLSIVSTSESGNYTITTSSGLWTGSETDITATGSDLYVNQPSGLASILVNDNSVSVR